MKSTELPSPPRDPLSIDARFRALRGAFYENLSQDCRNLDLLANQFTLVCERGDASVAASSLKEEIRAIAHRIYGAAAIFGAVAVGAAADALERTVFNTIVSTGTDDRDASARILDALANLVSVLAQSRRAVMADFS
jgi:HPt (histidine-containing phosphotransfer) domain-containing protein